MHAPLAPDAYLPTGLAFEIADLVLIQGWAVQNNLQMKVHLDHAAEGEEYEEAIGFHGVARLFTPLIIWRNASAVFVQPLIGRRQAYGSVGEALESLTPNWRVILTDIVATAWPSE